MGTIQLPWPVSKLDDASLDIAATLNAAGQARREARLISEARLVKYMAALVRIAASSCGVRVCVLQAWSHCENVCEPHVTVCGHLNV